METEKELFKTLLFHIMLCYERNDWEGVKYYSDKIETFIPKDEIKRREND